MPASKPALLALALVLPAAAGAAPPRTLAVAGAASLRPTLERLARAFEAERPGVRVRVTFGASGTLHAQIVAGAPFDVFLSADRASPRALVAAGLAVGEEPYAVGTLAVWIPDGSPLEVGRDGLRALAQPRARRIAIPNPALAPYGRAAEAALRRAGVWEEVRSRLVLGESAEQAAHFAHAGAADAALLPGSLVRLPALARAGRAVPVPQDAHPPIEQSAAVLARAKDPALARDFLRFVRGEKGRAILSEAGYGLP